MTKRERPSQEIKMVADTSNTKGDSFTHGIRPNPSSKPASGSAKPPTPPGGAGGGSRAKKS